MAPAPCYHARVLMKHLVDLSIFENQLFQKIRTPMQEGEFPVLVTKPKFRWLADNTLLLLFACLLWNTMVLLGSYFVYRDGHVVGCLFMIPFQLVGIVIIGSILYSLTFPQRTTYVLTNQRVIIEERPFCKFFGSEPRAISLHRNLVRSTRVRPDGSGDLVFGWDSDPDEPHVVTPYGFMDVPDIRRTEAAIDSRISYL